MTASTPTTQIVPILSGGGTRLPCYVGILHALEDMSLDFSTVVGVSGGSVVAALSAAGWSVPQMRALALDTDFAQFRGFSPLSLWRSGGLSSGDHFEHWIDAQLRGRSFADLDKDLHVLATDLNGGGPVVFNRRLTPQMKVSQAIRYSMSIPLLFSFKILDGQVMADGVILAEDALHRDWSGTGTPGVCFRLRSQPRRRPLKTNRMLPLATYMHLLVQTFMNAMAREYVHAEHWHSTVVVNTGDVSPLDFALSPQVRQQLLQSGYDTTREFLPRKLAAHPARAGAPPAQSPADAPDAALS